LEKTVVTTRKRLETASAKLAQAQEEGSDLVTALQTGVDKTRQKLETAEQALRTLVEPNTAGENEDPLADPAAAAIAKAKAARAADAGLSPAEKARDKLKGLEQRLEKTRARLAESQSIGEEQKIVDALASTVTRLEDKVNATREQLGNGGGA
jgi:electron transport complex protein RnfC